jgi:hypothetical protein
LSASGATIYGYVGGNPVNVVDPSGLCGIPCVIAYFFLENALAINTAGIVASEVAAGTAIAAGTGVAASTIAANAYRGSKLARNLAEAGRPVQQAKEACHHIVAKNAKKAQEARDKLKELVHNP